MDNPEKLSAPGTPDEENKAKHNITQYMLNTTMNNQIQIM